MPMNRKKFKIMIMFILILISWGCSVYLERFAMQNYSGVSVRLEGEGVLQGELENAVKQEQSKEDSGDEASVQVTAWSRGSRITIKNTNLNTSAQTRVIQVYGSMAKVCPMKLLYGNFCYEEDMQGCVIDEKTAYDLFRNKNVVGNSITYNSKQYIIRGVVKSKEQMVLILDNKKNTSFSNLELLFSDMENQEESAKNFITNYQLSSGYMTIVEGNFYAKLLHNTVLLPAIVIWGYFLILAGSQAFKRRTIPLQCIFYLSLFLFISILLFNNKQLQFYYPDRLIPTRWSDFNFWGRVFTEWKNKLYDFSYLLPLPKDKILKNTIILCNLMSALTIVQLLVFIPFLKEKSNEGADDS